MHYFVHEAAEEAIQEVSSWLRFAGEELHEYFCNVGTNTSMQALLKAAAVCWDWTWLVKNKPTKKHVQAFLELWQRLSLVAKHWEFPSDPTFRAVPHEMPTDFRTKGVLSLQYLVLCSRVREASDRATAQGGRLPPTVVECISGWYHQEEEENSPMVRYFRDAF